jgi:hypothetical protein
MEYADSTKLRAYFFGNMYLSPIQQGIQAAHVVTKLFAYYPTSQYGPSFYTLHAWANDGVTKILLNGGYQSNLAVIFEALETLCMHLELPFAKFHEEQDALNGALTSVGVVVPEEVYDKFALCDAATLKLEPLFGADVDTVHASMRDLIADAKFGTEAAERHLYFLLKSCRLA